MTLDTSDLDRAAAFYETLGLKRIVWSAPRYARFECPSGAATLSLHHNDRVEPSGAALYFEIDHLDAEVARLESEGVVFESAPEDKDWRWREAWLRDPDGHRICLYHAGPDRRFPPWRVAPQPETDG
ncbi:MAG: VOC family protein [Pseudomonadota bacterium]